MENSIKWILPSVFILAIIVFAVYLAANSTRRYYANQVERCLKEYAEDELARITAEDIQHLPQPVRNYLNYVGVVGSEKVRSFSVTIDGEFKMNPERDWASVNVQQMSFIENPTRLFYMTLKYMGLKIFGMHHYESASTAISASMKIKVLDLFTVADARGSEMNRGETVTVFNDMCILAPSTLIDSRITWEEVDELTARGTFTNSGISVSAILKFNTMGQLVDFVSDDRYFRDDNGSYKQYTWSTPVGEYRNINGLNIATYGEAFWIMEDGPFPYAKFNIREVTLNP